ncbi:hypothetical protein CRG98_034064 [Punica granatum]|uniref:Uncharacterized protein n=1 Tax=Punica granatum TaxID=22663 RepID=A0A2I0IQ44_PUNGR|nr:hypothetical protein CRG98_034064 [Punica granatum]
MGRIGPMDRWASERGWAGPNANGSSLLDWAGPLLDWAVTAGPCRKLGCSRDDTGDEVICHGGTTNGIGDKRDDCLKLNTNATLLKDLDVRGIAR